jgi:hypothetical protein
LPRAHAQEGASPKPGTNESEQLFNSARDLMASQRFEEACPMLSRSNQLMPAVGTALNLGLCYEKLGKSASAVLAYRQAMTMADAMGAQEAKRMKLARERVAALEPKLVRIQVIAVPENPATIEVKLDGVRLDKAQLGTSIPVDPEDHRIEASAPGAQPWQVKVNVAAESSVLYVTVPKLADTPVAPPPGPTTVAPVITQAPRSGARALYEIALAGVGIAGLAAGTALGIAAKSKYDDAQSLCGGSGCAPQAAGVQHSAVVGGNVATVIFIAGAAALAGAGVLWLTTPAPPSRTASGVVPSIGVGPGAVVARLGF